MKNTSVAGAVVLLLTSSSSPSSLCYGFVPSFNSQVKRCLQPRSSEGMQLFTSTVRSSSSSSSTSPDDLVLKVSNKTRKNEKRKRARNFSSSSRMLDHEILTKEEERILADRVKKAVRLREQMDDILLQQGEQKQSDDKRNDNVKHGNIVDNIDNFANEEFLLQDNDDSEDDDYYFYDELEKQEEKFKKSILSEQTVVHKRRQSDEEILVQLTNDQIIHNLRIPGGREELRTILQVGAQAKQELVQKNVRLVVSIAKKFAQKSAKGTEAGGPGPRGNRNQPSLVTVYSGDATRPSLEEAVQEGILGLNRAAEKFEPDKGFRFTTYSTFWVTNFVRRCYQSATTGCFRVPPNFYDIKHKYRVNAKKHFEAHGELPTLEVLADLCGVTTARLSNVLQLTRPLISLDAPLISNWASPGKAGADDSSATDLLLSNALPSDDPLPEEQVERSLLRQCLENAMATELSPTERDVLRLRLGLDDGQSRTVKEVVDLCNGSISMTEVRSAEKRAFRKLRSPYSLHTHELMSYSEFAGIDKDIIDADGTPSKRASKNRLR